MNVTANLSLKEKGSNAISTKKEVENKYFCEQFVPLFPALRVAGEEVKLTRSEILLLLSAKTFQRKHSSSFTAKTIESYSLVSYKNLNTALAKLAEKGFLKIEERGRRFSASPTRYAINHEGMKVVSRLDDLVMDFNLKLNVRY